MTATSLVRTILVAAAAYAMQASSAHAAVAYATWSGYVLANSIGDQLNIFGLANSPPQELPVTGTMTFDDELAQYTDGAYSSDNSFGATGTSGSDYGTPSLLTMTVTLNGVTATFHGGYNGIVYFGFGGDNGLGLEESQFSAVTTADYQASISIDVWDLGPPYQINLALGLAQDFSLTNAQILQTGNGIYPGCISGYCTSGGFGIWNSDFSAVSSYNLHITQFSVGDTAISSTPEPSSFATFAIACGALGVVGAMRRR
jgi:hypothetical protein